MKWLLAFALLAPTSAYPYSNEYGTSAFQFLGYKPSYFLMGKPNTKLQLSLKTRVIDKVDVYLGYTQLMFWDLFKKSSPFVDLNYNPEAFYRFRFGEEKRNWVDVGYAHESNGKDGVDSRSWDRIYVLFSQQSFLTLNEKSAVHWSVAAWAMVNRDYYNSDLQHYRGRWEANITVHDLFDFFDRNDITLRFYPGGKSGLNPLKGGRELTIRFNTARSQRALPVVTLQFFQGYGESLLRYKDRVIGFRGGFGF